MVTVSTPKRPPARSPGDPGGPWRAEDVLAHPDDPFPAFIPPIVRAEDVMDHPDDPLPDPPKRVDMEQERNVRYSVGVLEVWLARRWRKVLVTGEAYLCYATKPPGDTTFVKSDCMVGFGVTHEDLLPDMNGWVISELGGPPAFALEVASRSTGRRDYTFKREFYMRMRVREIFRFDSTGGRYHDAALAGDRLVDGEYASIPLFDCPEYMEDDALHIHSEVLELDICWRGGEFRYYDPVGDTHFLNWVELAEAQERLEARLNEVAEARRIAETRANDETEARRIAETRANDEATRADKEAKARRNAEAEAKRLREELRRLRGE